MWLGANSARAVERRAQAVEIGRAEHHAVARRDVHELEVDPRLCDLAREIGEHARAILYVDDHDLALTRHREVRDRERVLDRLRVGYEDVHLSALAGTDAGRGGEVDARVAYRARNLRESAR